MSLPQKSLAIRSNSRFSSSFPDRIVLGEDLMFRSWVLPARLTFHGLQAEADCSKFAD